MSGAQSIAAPNFFVFVAGAWCYAPGSLMRTPKVNWTPKRLARLGKEHDRHLAQAMGVGEWVVREKRRILGIPRCKILKWTSELIARLGKEPDSVIARSMGASLSAVGLKRRELRVPKFAKVKFNWTVTRTKMLGKKSDRRVAESLGLPTRMVTKKRVKLGIPSALAARWAPEILADIGRMPDLDLVKKHRYKVSRAAVRTMRLRRGKRLVMPA